MHQSNSSVHKVNWHTLKGYFALEQKILPNFCVQSSSPRQLGATYFWEYEKYFRLGLDQDYVVEWKTFVPLFNSKSKWLYNYFVMNPHLAKTIFFFSLFLKHAFKFFMNKRRKCICFNSPKVLLCCNHPFSICYSYHKMYQTPSYSLMASLCSEIKVLSLPWLYQKDSFCVYNLHHPNKILHL